jgi:hypothetical protein
LPAKERLFVMDEMVLALASVAAAIQDWPRWASMWLLAVAILLIAAL